MASLVPGLNDTNQILHETFLAFSGHTSFTK